ncbi:MAG: hypothetical protein ACK4SN_10785, partial [Bellilinea sp.]
IAPLFGLLVLMTIKRDQIPFLRFFERIGKKSYGLYLTNLIMINVLFFVVIHFELKQLLQIQPLLVTWIATTTILFPVLVMEWIERTRGRAIYRFVFG